MTAVCRVALFTALAATSIPTAAAGQSPSTDSLVRRVDSLERRIVDLELRVGALQALILATSPQSRPAPNPASARDVANWRQLGRGMRMDQVRALLGEPTSVDTYSAFTIWRYPGGATVNFDSDNKVEGWSEPNR